MNIRQRVDRFSVWAWVSLEMLPHRPARSHAGQSATEAAMIMAFVAIVCVPAIGVLREAFEGLYLVHQQSLGGPPATPTPTP